MTHSVPGTPAIPAHYSATYPARLCPPRESPPRPSSLPRLTWESPRKLWFGRAGSRTHLDRGGWRQNHLVRTSRWQRFKSYAIVVTHGSVPSVRTIVRSIPTSYTAHRQSHYSFSGPISLSVSGLPAGASA